MVRRASRPIAALLLAAAAAAGCSGTDDPGDAGISVLLVSLDTVRADHTSLLGYPRPTTPRLEALAREGATFRTAYAMTSTTGPSHATLFTGRYAPEHGVVRNGVPLAEEARTLAELLAAHGHRTAGILGSFVLAERFGFAQGFSHWDEAFTQETSSMPMDRWMRHEVPGRAFDRTAAETTQRALGWLGDHGRAGPYLLFVHYFEAHEPYTPSEEEVARLAHAPLPVPGDPLKEGASPEDIERYDAEIAIVDRELGVLLDGLDALGLAERTLVVVTTDHGQGLADHDDSEHGVNLHEETVRSLLVVRGPGVVPGVHDAPVEAADVMPTLLDWVAPELLAEVALPGRSLAPTLRGEGEPAADRPVFLYRQHYERRKRVRHAWVNGSQYGVRVGAWKYIEGDRDGRRELYDLENDPGELRNVARDEPERAADLRALLHAWRTQHPWDGSAAPELSDEDRARLEALGYVE